METLTEIGKRIAKLIDVKSIVTLTLTIVFAILTMNNILSTEFITIYTVIIGFYFGTQKTKAETTQTSYVEQPCIQHVEAIASEEVNPIGFTTSE